MNIECVHKNIYVYTEDNLSICDLLIYVYILYVCCTLFTCVYIYTHHYYFIIIVTTMFILIMFIGIPIKPIVGICMYIDVYSLCSSSFIMFIKHPHSMVPCGKEPF